MKKVLIAYIPALHQGYVSFLKKYTDLPLYVVSDELLAQLEREKPYYGRDIRALPAGLMVAALRGLQLTPQISLLDQRAIAELSAREPFSVVTPDEDISHDIVEKFFPKTKVEYINTFLRWDKRISEKEYEVQPDRLISDSDVDRELMEKAFEEGGKSSDWWRQIGAVAVQNGQVVISAYNKNLPRQDNPNVLGDPRSNFDAGVRIDLVTTIHAEAAVIAEAARRGVSLAKSSLYVSTFPCPPCARLIVGAGIKKLYYTKGYSLFDSEELLKNAGVEIVLVKI